MQRAYYYDQSERATDTDNPVNQWEFKANTFLSLVFPYRIGGHYSCKRGKTIITSTRVTFGFGFDFDWVEKVKQDC